MTEKNKSRVTVREGPDKDFHLKLGLEVSTVETNRDRDVSTCLHDLFQSVKTSFFKCRDRESRPRPSKNQDLSRLKDINFIEICRDVIFQTVKNFSTLPYVGRDMVFQMSRSSVSIETTSGHIETPKLT
jgi:hypothetical protein